MKPWLFDILACPIDKHYPLELIIFAFETTESTFESILKEYEKKEIQKIEDQDTIKVFEKTGNKFLLKDDIVIEKSSPENYLNLILKSIEEMSNFSNKSSLEISKQCFQLTHKQIKPSIENFISKEELSKIETILPELVFLNKMKIEVEIKSGMIYCEKCNRWFPIVDTIPQMLPDEYRDKKKDLEFLKTNKNLLDQKFLNKDLKPYK